MVPRSWFERFGPAALVAVGTLGALVLIVVGLSQLKHTILQFDRWPHRRDGTQEHSQKLPAVGSASASGGTRAGSLVGVLALPSPSIGGSPVVRLPSLFVVRGGRSGSAGGGRAQTPPVPAPPAPVPPAAGAPVVPAAPPAAAAPVVAAAPPAGAPSPPKSGKTSPAARQPAPATSVAPARRPGPAKSVAPSRQPVPAKHGAKPDRPGRSHGHGPKPDRGDRPAGSPPAGPPPASRQGDAGRGHGRGRDHAKAPKASAPAAPAPPAGDAPAPPAGNDAVKQQRDAAKDDRHGGKHQH